MLSLWRPRWWLLGKLSCAVLSLAVLSSPVAADEDTALQKTQAFLQKPREVPSDPPGIPATRKGARQVHARLGSFTNVQVNVDGNGANILGDAASEPSIAVDPTFPNHMAIGWRQFGTIFSTFRQAGVAYSRDGGRSWTFNGPLDPSIFRSDPVLAASANGTFYYNSLKVETGNYTCQVFESANGGMSWGPPVPAQGGDKAWMTVDRSGGMGHGHLYESWSTAAGCCGANIFSRSTNANVSWSTPIAIPQSPVWGTLTVDSNGYLWIVGISNLANRVLVTCSIDAQNAAFSPILFTTSANIGGNVVAGLGGTSPNPEGLLGQVWIDVDRSGGPRDGWLYIVSSVDPTGTDPLDVHFIRSTDGGLTWSAPVRLNNDPSTTAWQWMATMSVAPNGRIDVIWNDTRNTGLVNESELFTISSSNGGSTWTPNKQISTSWDSHLGWPGQQKIGDYYHMISDDVGAHLAWAATFNGEQDIYYLRIGDYDCNSNGVADSLDIAQLHSPDLNSNGIPDECEADFSTSDAAQVPHRWTLHPSVPNPFNPMTRLAFDVERDDVTVFLDVFDVLGRHVRSLVAERREVGRQYVEWDGRDDAGRSLASGVYVARLQAAENMQTQRMVLIR